MEIFNIMIFGEDAQNFLKLSKKEQRDFIIKHTNQKDDYIIYEFLDNLKGGFKEDENCFGCGLKNVTDGENISKRDVEASSTSEQQSISSANSKRTNNKRRTNSKNS